MRLLVTGAGGFVGKFLTNYLGVLNDIELITSPKELDIRDPFKLKQFCSLAKPDNVIHLAAQSFVPQSINNSAETYAINFIGSLNLLQALKEAGFSGRFIYVSTSDVYGTTMPSELPITEACIPKPQNPYAVSKAAAELLCLQWNMVEDLKIIIARPFNHIGPGQDPRYVISSICRQVALIKLKKQPNLITVGNVNVTRDFTDVRDVARAYLCLLREGIFGEIYNICSGKEYLIRSLIENISDIAKVDFELRIDAERFRPADQQMVYGLPLKLQEATGWRPQIPIRQSCLDMFNWWYEKERNDD